MTEQHITIVSSKRAWLNKKSVSTIDYIMTNHLTNWVENNKWGVDKSDHALIEVSCTQRNDNGPGVRGPIHYQYGQPHEQSQP
jgi:hypothetical protein